MFKKIRHILFAILPVVLLTLSQHGEAWAKKAETDIHKRAANPVKNTPVQTPAAATTESGLPAFEDTGVDLVVSKVIIQRGSFHDGKTIRVTPYIKNMCNGRHSGRIKILLRGLDTAEWIETGIGSRAEKAGGALYFHENDSGGLDTFSVVADNDDDISENNDSNNTCPDIQFAGSQAGKTHHCSIRGVRCPDAPNPGRNRARDPVMR